METLEQKLEALKALGDRMCQIIEQIDGEVSVTYHGKVKGWMIGPGLVSRGPRIDITVRIGAIAGDLSQEIASGG